jgi:hypothetical protein
MTDENRGCGWLSEPVYDKKIKRNINKPVLDKNGNTIPINEWQIDHVIPLACIIKSCKKFKIKIKDVKPNYYKNLRAEWASKNKSKNDRILLKSKKKTIFLLDKIFYRHKELTDKIYNLLLEKGKINH